LLPKHDEHEISDECCPNLHSFLFFLQLPAFADINESTEEDRSADTFLSEQK